MTLAAARIAYFTGGGNSIPPACCAASAWARSSSFICATMARDPATRDALLHAAREETDHLAWCAQRLRELDDRPSLLNPLWYAGSYAIGVLAGLRGDGWNLGFVVETERQVEAHLQGHLDRLPATDHASRAIVAQMKADEMAHAAQALEQGATELPGIAKGLMRAAAKVMTTTAHYI